MKYTFTEWMILVNDKIDQRIGCEADDLPDCPYHDWYDQDIPPVVAASRAIRNAHK